MAKKGVSGAEARGALLLFFIGLAAVPLLWLFGRWVIDGFVGPGVLFFGYGFAYVAPPILIIFAIYSFSRLFRSAQKKKPEGALRWFFEVVLIGDTFATSGRFSKMDYAIATLERAAHNVSRFDKSAAEAYITQTRELLAKGMDLTTAKAKGGKKSGWNEGSPLVLLKIDNERDLFPGAVEVAATLVYRDQITSQDSKNRTVTKVTAVLELHIVFSLVRSGKYWYPFDIYPAATCRRDLNAGSKHGGKDAGEENLEERLSADSSPADATADSGAADSGSVENPAERPSTYSGPAEGGPVEGAAASHVLDEQLHEQQHEQ
jgi:hypothetical protein